jgi:hypothetical protein
MHRPRLAPSAFGSSLYVICASSFASITQHRPRPAGAMHQHFSHRPRLASTAWPELRAHVTVWVGPEDGMGFARSSCQHKRRGVYPFPSKARVRGDADRPAAPTKRIRRFPTSS